MDDLTRRADLKVDTTIAVHVTMQMQISMVKVNVVMPCKILKSLNVVMHAKLIIQRGLCNQIKIPKRKRQEN